MTMQLPDKDILPGSQARIWFEGDFWMTGRVVSSIGRSIEIGGQPPGPVRPGMAVVVEIGLPNGVYRFRSQFKSRDQRSIIVEAPTPGTVEHQQRRQYYRVEADLPALVQVSGQELPARVLNLSAGGALVRLNAAPPIGALVDMVIDLQGRALATQGKVVRVLRSTTGQSFEMGVSFQYLKPDVQDRIVGYTFAKQVQGEKRAEARRPQPAPPSGTARAPQPAAPSGMARAPQPARPAVGSPPARLSAAPPIQGSDEQLVERTCRFVERLPESLDATIKRSVVLASLESSAVPLERLLAAIQLRRAAVTERLAQVEREREALSAREASRAAELEERRTHVQACLDSGAETQRLESEAVDGQLRALDELAALFGAGAAGQAQARAAMFGDDDQADPAELRLLDQIQRFARGLQAEVPGELTLRVLQLCLSSFDLSVEGLLDCLMRRRRALEGERERARAAGAWRRQEYEGQLAALERELQSVREENLTRLTVLQVDSEELQRCRTELEALAHLLAPEPAAAEPVQASAPPG